MVRSSLVPTSAEKRSISYCVLLVVLVLFALLYLMRSAGTPDFKALYRSGKVVLAQHGHAPESDAVREEMRKADTLHAPVEMLIFAPLALLSYRAAYLVWFCCNLLMLLCVPALLWNHLPNLHRWFHYLLILIASFFPALVCLLQGQDSILLLFLLTCCYVCLSTGREFRAGALLAMGMYKFVLVVPIVLALALNRRWRALGGFASGCVALLGASIGLVGWAGVMGYVQMILGLSKRPPEVRGSEVFMPNLRGFFHSLGSGVVPEKWLVVATLLVSVAIWVAVNRRLRTVGASELDLYFSMQVIVAVAVSYHLYPHDAVILALPLLLMLNRCAGLGFGTPLGRTFAITAFAIYVCPLISPPRISMPIVFCACMGMLMGLYLSVRERAFLRFNLN